MRSSTYRGDDRDLGAVRNRRRQLTQESNILVAQKNIDMLAHFALFVREPVAQPGITCPQLQQNIAKRSGPPLDFDLALSIGIDAQRAWDMEDDRHYFAFALDFGSPT